MIRVKRCLSRGGDQEIELSSTVIKVGELPVTLRKRLGCAGRAESEHVRVSVSEVAQATHTEHEHPDSLPETAVSNVREPVTGGVPQRPLSEEEIRKRLAIIASIKPTKAPVATSAEEIIRIIRDEDF